jgi:hypothetical protein
MKKLFVTKILILCILVSAQAQTPIIQTATPVTFINLPKKGLDNTSTRFNTFLVNEWLPGTIRLEDGRNYDSYKIKFNAAAQILMYLNNNEALEVDEKIKSFSFTTTQGLERTFVNANQYGEKSSLLYLEIVLEDKKGSLLRSFKRTKSFGSENILNGDNPKNSDLVVNYFFYGTNSNFLFPLKKSKKQIAEHLNLTAEQEKALNFSDVKFNSEESMITFFSNYFLLK